MALAEPGLLLAAQAIAVALGAAARLLARREAPRLGAGRRSGSRSPTCSTRRRVADPERVPPGRARLPAAAVRVLVPRRGPPGPVRALRRVAALRPRRRSRSSSPGLGIWYALARRRRTGARDRGGRRRRRGRAIAIEVVIPHFNRGQLELLHALQPRRRHRRAGSSAPRSPIPWELVTTAFTGRGLGYLLRAAAPARRPRAARAARAASPRSPSSRSTCSRRRPRRPRSATTTRPG